MTVNKLVFIIPVFAALLLIPTISSSQAEIEYRELPEIEINEPRHIPEAGEWKIDLNGFIEDQINEVIRKTSFETTMVSNGTNVWFEETSLSIKGQQNMILGDIIIRDVYDLDAFWIYINATSTGPMYDGTALLDLYVSEKLDSFMDIGKFVSEGDGNFYTHIQNNTGIKTDMFMMGKIKSTT